MTSRPQSTTMQDWLFDEDWAYLGIALLWVVMCAHALLIAPYIESWLSFIACATLGTVSTIVVWLATYVACRLVLLGIWVALVALTWPLRAGFRYLFRRRRRRNEPAPTIVPAAPASEWPLWIVVSFWATVAYLIRHRRRG